MFGTLDSQKPIEKRILSLRTLDTDPIQRTMAVQVAIYFSGSNLQFNWNSIEWQMNSFAERHSNDFRQSAVQDHYAITNFSFRTNKLF